jgi:molybdopterin-guanine dinucleotide biosynthesis protein B
VIASKHRLAKLREFEAEVPVTVHQLLAELVECDWALVEGFKHADLLRIELWREGGAPPAYPDDPYVVAIAAPDPAHLPVPTGRPVFALDDAAGVARYLLGDAGRFDYTAPP